MPSLNVQALDAVAPAVLYEILALRVRVFVVEQECAYPELDGRDAESSAELLWVAEDGAVLATARLLEDRDTAAGLEMRIGRVATDAAARGRGLAGELMRAAIARSRERAPEAPIVLDAQAHLAGWYGGFGFVVAGETFLEDGIPHVPMRLA